MQVFGDYMLLGELGRGGTAVVWEARHLRLHTSRAIKILSEETDPRRSERAIERFLTEAKVLARLEHESIVQVYAAGQQGGRRFIEMELVEGGSLAQSLALQRPTPEEAARWTLALAQALACAHNAGVLHRDIKPGNVLLTRDGRVKLGDFGLARELDDAAAWTRTIGAVGTPAFMAPEVARDGMDAFTARSDLYALGAVLYQMLTGQVPHAGSDPLQVLESVRSRRPPSPRSRCPDVPVDLEVLCLRCMEPDPAHRFASAHELAEELERYLDGIPIRSRPAGPVRHMVAWARRHRALAASLVLLFIALTGGLGLVTWQRIRAEKLAVRLASNLAVARLGAAQAHWEAANNLRAVADIARAVHEGGPDEDARRMLESWIYEGVFVLPPEQVWKHAAPVLRVVFTPDDRHLVVQLANRDLFVYPAHSPKPRLHLPGVAMGQPSIPGITADTLLVRQTNGVLKLWSLPPGDAPPAVLWELPRIQIAAVSAPARFWAAVDESGDVWTGDLLTHGVPHREPIDAHAAAWRRLAISPGGSFLVGADTGTGWDLWARSGAHFGGAARFHNETPALVEGIAFNASESQMVVCGRGFLHVWNPRTLTRTIDHSDRSHWVGTRFDGSGRRIYVTDLAGGIHKMDPPNRQLQPYEKGALNGRIRLSSTSPDIPDLQRYALLNPSVTFGADNTLRMHPAAGQHQVTVIDHPAPVSCFSNDAGRTHIVTGCEDGSVRVWRAQRHVWSPRIHPDVRPIESLVPVPRGAPFLLVRREETALWNPSVSTRDVVRLAHSTLRQPIPIPGDASGPDSLIGFDPEGKALLFQSVEPSSPITLAALPETAHRIAANPDGRRVAWAGPRRVGWVRQRRGTVSVQHTLDLPEVQELVVAGKTDRFWALTKQGTLHEIDATGSALQPRSIGVTSPVVQMEASGDGHALVVLGSNGVAEVHDPRARKGVVPSLTLPQPIRMLATAPRDARVALATQRDVHVWDPTGDGTVVAIRGLPGTIHHLVFHPAGDVLAVTTRSDVLRLYSTRTGLPLGPPWTISAGRDSEGGFKVAFSNDGQRLVGWSASGLRMDLPLPHRTGAGKDRSDPLIDLAIYVTDRHLRSDGPRHDPEEPLSAGARQAVLGRLRDARAEGRWDPRWEIFLPQPH